MKLADATGLSKFLDDSIVATVAVQIDQEGTLHIATMHYAHTADPLNFYFVTQRTSEKCRLLTQQETVKAACNIGTVVGTPFTLQMRGVARMLEPAEHPELLDRYYEKRGDKNRNVEGPGTVIVQFTPDWARFTDYSKGWDTTMLDLA